MQYTSPVACLYRPPAKPQQVSLVPAENVLLGTDEYLFPYAEY